jgi:hypothetical protein
MKVNFGIAAMLGLICLLSACQTTNTTYAPDRTAVEPSQQEMNQERLQGALQS